MTLPIEGAQLALADAGNGRVTVRWSGGNPVFDDDQRETVLSLLLESPGWFGDSGRKRRSQIPTVTTKDAATPGRLAQYAKDALQPAIDDGRLRSVDSVDVQPAGSGYLVVVGYTTGTGKQVSLSTSLST